MHAQRFCYLGWSTAVHRTPRHHIPGLQSRLLAAGPLPSEWARIQSIREMYVSYNRISGTLAVYQLDARLACVACLHAQLAATS